MNEADQAQPQDTPEGRKPDFIAYNVTEARDGKGHWNRIGAAWQHRDGEGFDLQLDSFPVYGRVTLRELRDERMQGYEAEQQARAQEPSTERAPARSRSRGRSR